MTRFSRSPFVLALLLVSCASAPDVPLGQSFVLRFGETARVGPAGLSITFADVEDSRCPRQVTCVWQGTAAVLLRVGREEIRVEVPGSAGAGQLRIELQELNPYPLKEPPAKSEYEATLVVR